MNSSEIEVADVPGLPKQNFFTNPIQKWKVLFFLLLVPLVCIYYIFLTVPFLEGYTEAAPVVYDSRTYMQFATDSPGWEGVATMALANRNLIGPLSLLNVLGNNSLVVLIFNLSLFYFCLNIFFTSAQFQNVKFFLALIANPLMLSCLTSINKEVLSVCSLLIALAYTFSSRRKHLYLSLFLSLFVRQELTVLLIGYAITRRVTSKRWRLLLLSGATLALSVMLPLYDTSTVDILSANQTEKSVGISVFLSDLTSNYLFFIAVIPKILLNLFGDIKMIFGGGDEDLYAYSAWSGLAFLIACFRAKNRFLLVNDPFFLMASYWILFATPSFIHHRYFFPVYVVLLTLVFFVKRNDESAPVRKAPHLPTLDNDTAPAASS